MATFVSLAPVPSNADWPDWRGSKRDGRSFDVPKTLPEKPKVLWRAELTGPAMAGITATNSYVLVADKSADANDDLFHCFDSRAGKLIWTIRQHAPGRMEYTNAPRATPVIVGDLVYFQAAFGQLTCARLTTGEIVWEKHLARDLGGELPTWGYCVPPLVLDDQLIVAPGGIQASLISLDRHTGKTRWTCKGNAAAYAPFIARETPMGTQIIGYDSAGLGGWDAETGKKLWHVVPPDNSDFNVPTPVEMEDHILLATENNGTRMYRFFRGWNPASGTDGAAV